jgi:predicted membrane protein
MNSRTLRHVWLPFAGLMLSSVISVALLWRPEALSGLSWQWRLPLVLLGLWAVGAGFMHGVGVTAPRRWLRQLMAAPVCWWGLVVFALFVFGRMMVA